MAEEDFGGSSSDTGVEDDGSVSDSSGGSADSDSIFSADDEPSDEVAHVLYFVDCEVRLPGSPPVQFRGNIFTTIRERISRDDMTFYYDPFEECWRVLPDIFTVLAEHDDDQRGE